jgi:hypothetical protein
MVYAGVYAGVISARENADRAINDHFRKSVAGPFLNR